MSIEQVKAFAKQIDAKTELQEKMRVLSSLPAMEAQAAFIGLAKEQGFAFTEVELNQFGQEVAQATQKQGEITDEQLEGVAGGFSMHWFAASVSSLGATCAGSAITNAIESNTCWIKD